MPTEASLNRLVRLLERYIEEEKRERKLERLRQKDPDAAAEWEKTFATEWERTRDAFLARYSKRRGTVHKHRPIRPNNC